MSYPVDLRGLIGGWSNNLLITNCLIIGKSPLIITVDFYYQSGKITLKS